MPGASLLEALLLGPLPLLAGAAVSLLAAVTGPNPVLGLRTGPLTSSPEAWRRTHYLLAAMFLALAAASAAVGLSMGVDAEAVLLAASTPLLVLAAVVHGEHVAELEQMKRPMADVEKPTPLPALSGPRRLLVLTYSATGVAALCYGCLMLLRAGLPAAALVVGATGFAEAGFSLYAALRRPWTFSAPWLSQDASLYALTAVPVAASAAAGFIGFLVARHIVAALAYLASAAAVLILLYPPLLRRLRRGLRQAPARG